MKHTSAFHVETKDSYATTKHMIQNILSDAGIGITSKVEKACHRLGLPHQTGAAFLGNGERIIAYDEKIEGWERYFTIFHELGHHLLGHLAGPSDKDQMEHNEEEARMFSALLTALCVFHQYGSHTQG